MKASCCVWSWPQIFLIGNEWLGFAVILSFYVMHICHTGQVRQLPSIVYGPFHTYGVCTLLINLWFGLHSYLICALTCIFMHILNALTHSYYHAFLTCVTEWFYLTHTFITHSFGLLIMQSEGETFRRLFFTMQMQQKCTQPHVIIGIFVQITLKVVV